MSEDIKISEYELLALLVAASKASCGFDNIVDNHNLWEFHCCDYNEPVYKLAQQLKGYGFVDNNYKAFIDDIVEQGKEYYEKGDEAL